MLECTTISLKEIPHFSTIYNCCFLYNLGDINRTFYCSPLLTHRETPSAVQPLFVLTHGISSRKKEQEKGRLACWSIPCAMFCPNTACSTSHGQGQGLYWKQSCCSDTGAKQLSTLQNRASPFQSNIKCVFYHCKHPGVILHASDPSSYLQTSALCWQTHSCKALQCQERQ